MELAGDEGHFLPKGVEWYDTRTILFCRVFLSPYHPDFRTSSRCPSLPESGCRRRRRSRRSARCSSKMLRLQSFSPPNWLRWVLAEIKNLSSWRKNLVVISSLALHYFITNLSHRNASISFYRTPCLSELQKYNFCMARFCHPIEVCFF